MTVVDFVDSNAQSLLYLKDWHFQSQYPEYSAYETPLYFQSDWLNEYCDHKRHSIEKDYRFVYIGQQGTWYACWGRAKIWNTKNSERTHLTSVFLQEYLQSLCNTLYKFIEKSFFHRTPFHVDVFRSFSWSANICGRKLWYLVPPGQEKTFKNSQNDFDLYGSGSTDLRKYKSEKNFENVITFVQNPGEILFIPSNWYHQVHNLDVTISINHNWLNGANIEKVWYYLKRKLSDVKHEIEHCKDLLDDVHKQYQLILKADVGIDYSEFNDLIRFIESNRLREMN
uniref:Jumonji domain-containing protein 4 n=1 Tax=Romanomermis culicivorax TaxID=13658 RepID=A0A915JDK5_ROMCU